MRSNAALPCQCAYRHPASDSFGKHIGTLTVEFDDGFMDSIDLSKYGWRYTRTSKRLEVYERLKK